MQKNKSKYLHFLITLSILVVTIISTSAQGKIPPKPSIETSVYDYAALLNTAQLIALEDKLIKYNDTTSTQIVVATIRSLEGKNIALFATEWAHKWGIGDAEKDNGVFVLVAKNDRKLTIRTGYGVEHKLTDAYSRRIIEQVITPAFKQDDYYYGLDKGTTYIMRALDGEFQGSPQKNQSNGEGIPIVFIIFFIIILIIILFNRNKRNDPHNKHRNLTGSILETIILSNRGRGGFSGGGFGGSSGSGGFGSSSGGGFSGGFGGGGFGGGGASGSW